MASSGLAVKDGSSSISLKRFQARDLIPLIVAGSKHFSDGFVDSVWHSYAVPSFTIRSPHVDERSIDGE
jgi:hypothetical protein